MHHLCLPTAVHCGLPEPHDRDAHVFTGCAARLLVAHYLSPLENKC